jgi:uncharacterized membrane protein YraQ (UPF0718 family)
MFDVNNFIAAGEFFIEIAGELIIIFVAVSFIIGLLMEYLPPSRVRDYLSNKLIFTQYFLGAGLGAITPFCSCSTVPITAGLLKGGVPFGPTMSFLFSSPVLNPIIIALLFSLLGLKVTMVYVVVTFFGSMVTAAVLSSLGMENQVKPLLNLQTACCAQEARPASASSACCAAEQAGPIKLVTFPTIQAKTACCAPAAGPESAASCRPSDDSEAKNASESVSFKDKLKRASSSAMTTFKGVFWYLLLGAGIGAFIYGFFPKELVVNWAGPDNPWSIPVAAAIGVPMYIRAETVIPISAALLSKGMGVGTVLALIIGGAGASIPEMIILASMFKKKLIFAFAFNVFLVAILAGYLVDILVY